MKPQTRFRLRYIGRLVLFALAGFVLANVGCLIYYYFS